MRNAKIGSWLVLLLGYMCVGIALVMSVTDHVGRFVYSLRSDLGIIIGTANLAALGVIALIVGQCLKNLEKQSNRSESSRNARRSDASDGGPTKRSRHDVAEP
jgi:hypothetical protein